MRVVNGVVKVLVVRSLSCGWVVDVEEKTKAEVV